MQSTTMMLYKGKKSDESTESVVFSWTADKVNICEDGEVLQFLNKDGTVGAELTLQNGAKLRKVG